MMLMSELTCVFLKGSILHANNLQGTFREITENKFSVSNIFLPTPFLFHLLL